MTIKAKLGFSFILMTGLVGVVGLTLIFSTRMTHAYFERRLASEVESHFAKELQSAVEGELQSASLFFALGEPEDERRFREQQQAVETKLSPLPDQESIDPALKDVKTAHSAVGSKAEEIMRLYGQDKKSQALDLMDVSYTPRVKSLKQLLTRYTETRLQAAAEEQEKVAGLMRRLTALSGGLLAFATALGITLSIVIFRSIAQPLAALRASATLIGAGQWDHIPKVASKDEFGQLARAFREMAENLKKMQTQITQMDRMSSVGQLAGGVAHELNNPLTGVLGQSQILLSRLPAEDPSRAHVEKIERAALRCRKIVRGLLDFSRQKEYQFQPHQIHSLIEETLSLCETELTACKVTVVKDYDPKLTEVLCSGPHIEQVFLNLITNALQAMPQGGRLVIRSRLKGSEVTVSFEDSGMGIKPEHMTHLFDPFFTTKEIGKGTGLGLTVSFGIIQNHGGAITASSAGEKKGAVFTVRLPLKAVKAKTEGAA